MSFLELTPLGEHCSPVAAHRNLVADFRKNIFLRIQVTPFRNLAFVFERVGPLRQTLGHSVFLYSVY
jgi:hypothetical protein